MNQWLVLLIVAAVMAVVAYSFYLYDRRCAAAERACWRIMDELEADKRALTEALVREQGKPLVFKRETPQPGAGWFDAKTQTKVGKPL